jgi:Flp pilus assembly protein TadG
MFMRKLKQRGVILIVGTMSLIFIVPLIGLGIDVGFLFAVNSKLQGAVDGASLAAALALSLGATTAAQASSAQSNAVNWFYANFPNGYFGTHSTVMSTANVSVFNDPNNPNLQHVTMTATTQVDAFFMRWFGYTSTTVGASSDATRRDAVIMMVLDRSGSMNTSGSCPSLISAAKLFTGQFAAGRDYIGAVSFSDGTYLHTVPTTSFQSVLGYTNDSGSSTGSLDTIQCNGGTGTPQAVAIAYDQLYKVNLPGAYNILMFETDGLPNTLTLNWWDNVNTVAGIASGSNCTDINNKKISASGFQTLASLRNWTSGHAMASSAYSNVPQGIVGAMYSGDPAQAQFNSEYFLQMFYPWQSGVNSSSNSSYVTSTANGCSFNSGSAPVENMQNNDLAWVPLTDVYGNSLNPANSFAGAVTTTGGGRYLSLAGSNSTQWTNYHAGVLNATDNAAYRVRTNATLPTTVFVIGLGGNCTPSCTSSPRTGDPPDYVLLQRMANDPNGDLYNTPQSYGSCASESNCINYPSQPIGTFIYSVDKTQLVQAFLSVSSQILRLSH